MLRTVKPALRALFWCWIAFALSVLIAYAAVWAIVGLRLVSAKAAEKAALADPGGDAFDELAASGIPETFVFVLFNGTAVITIWIFLVLRIGLGDPGRADRFPRLLRRLILADANSMQWFWPFRAKVRTEIRDVYASTRVLPFLVPAILGVHMGFLTASLPFSDDLLKSTLIQAALLLPHGVFEGCGLFMPGVFLAVLFRELRQSMIQGDASDVWKRVHEALDARNLSLWVAVSLLLIVVAAVIEASATEPIAETLAAAVGRPLE